MLEKLTLSSESAKDAGALRTIGEVAELLDVPQHVLRFWEDKFPEIDPIRRKNRRYYSPDNIEIVLKIKCLLYKEGYTIKGVQNYLKENYKTPVKLELIESVQIEEKNAPQLDLSGILQELKNLRDKLVAVKS